MEKAKIIFKNGIEIEAEENASSLITDSKPDLPSDLSVVVVNGSEGERIYKNAEIIECASIDGRYWFTIREVTETDKIAKQMQANIEYIAMMAEIDLEEV